jgi:hypothetical protein
LRQIRWAKFRVQPAALGPHVIDPLIDALGGHPRAEEERSGDLAIGPPRRGEGSRHASGVDAVDFSERRVKGIAVSVGGSPHERPVDIEEEQRHAGAVTA